MGLFDWVGDAFGAVGDFFGVGGGDDDLKPTFYDPAKDFSEGGLLDYKAYDPLGSPGAGSERSRLEAGDPRAEAAALRSQQAIDSMRDYATGGAQAQAQAQGLRDQRMLGQQLASQAAGKGMAGRYRQMQQTSEMGANVADQARLRGEMAANAARQGWSQAAAGHYGQQLGAEKMRRGMSLGLGQYNKGLQGQANQDRLNLVGGQQKVQGGMYGASEEAAASRFGGLMNAGASAAAIVSDRRAKENVEGGGGALDAMLDKLQPAMFDYKPGVPGGDDQRHGGIMAQDLAESEAGRGAVTTNPQTGMLGVDSSQAAPLALAAAASLHDRLKKLEGGAVSAGAELGAPAPEWASKQADRYEAVVSDRRAKENVEGGGGAMHAMLDKMRTGDVSGHDLGARDVVERYPSDEAADRRRWSHQYGHVADNMHEWDGGGGQAAANQAKPGVPMSVHPVAKGIIDDTIGQGMRPMLTQVPPNTPAARYARSQQEYDDAMRFIEKRPLLQSLNAPTEAGQAQATLDQIKRAMNNEEMQKNLSAKLFE